MLESSNTGFLVRTAERTDVPALVELLTAYMQETFATPWHGSAEALHRDGFGAEFDTEIAVSKAGRPIGFVSWSKSYDLHHCIAGGYIIDMYVSPNHRGRGVALALLCAVAAGVARHRGAFVKGKAVDNPAIQAFYERVAMCFPGADCIIGGRAFRHLADLAGRSPKTAIRQLPNRSWNYEP